MRLGCGRSGVEYFRDFGIDGRVIIFSRGELLGVLGLFRSIRF